MNITVSAVNRVKLNKKDEWKPNKRSAYGDGAKIKQGELLAEECTGRLYTDRH